METIPSRRVVADRAKFPWKIFWLLLIASVFGIVTLLPYLLALFRKVIATSPLPMPMPVLLTVQVMQSVILFAGFISLGLILARKVGMEMPVLRRWAYGGPAPSLRNFALTPLLVGAAAAALVVLVFYTFFLPRIPEWPIDVEAAIPIWKRFLACFYGAINEEIFARLFALSLILWLLRKIARQQSPQASPVIFWIANVVVAGLFAAGHIPGAKAFLAITPMVWTAIFFINGSLSLVFGYLCWKRGLAAAMLAHFSADFMLHVVGPMFFRG